MLRILMIGPRRGHNIMRHFDLFQMNKERYKLSFYSYVPKVHHDQGAYPDIDFVSLFNVPGLLWRLLRANDILWIHMHTPIPIIFFALLFRNRKSIVNYNIWSESIPRKALKNNWRGRAYRYIMRSADHVMCPWYATYQIIKDNIPGVNLFVHPMGMNGEFFLEEGQQPTDDTKEFCASLEPERKHFFYPKSFSRDSRHDLVIEAAKRLLERGIGNFRIYLWTGNKNDETLIEKYNGMIDAYGLQDHVRLVKHSFVPTYDIKYIWRAMDFGLQIAANDLLSTTLLEPMFLKKEFVASDIPPYHHIERRYEVDLGLVPLDTEAITDRMQGLIEGTFQTPRSMMEKRSTVVEQQFNTYNNIPSIVDHLVKSGRSLQR